MGMRAEQIQEETGLAEPYINENDSEETNK